MVKKLHSKLRVNLCLYNGLPLILSTNSVDNFVNICYAGENMSSNNESHGDEDFIREEARRCAEEYEAEHASDYKYTDEWLNIRLNK